MFACPTPRNLQYRFDVWLEELRSLLSCKCFHLFTGLEDAVNYNDNYTC